MAVLGIDVGGTSVRVGTAVSRTCRHLGPEHRVPDSVAGLVDHVASEWAARHEGTVPDAVVAALPGRTGEREPVWVPNLPFLDRVPLADLLASRLGVAVESCRLVNDGQAALVGEATEGVAVGARNALLVVIGTGIGGAMIMDGRLVLGDHGSAGSFGWVSAAGGEPDGMHGPWEQVASGTALERAGAELGGARAAVAAARTGDPRAIRVLTAYAERLGVGLAALASVLDPEVVVIGGGVSSAFDVLAEPLQEAFSAHASPVVRHVTIRPAGLGARAGMIGALSLALDRWRSHGH